MFAYSPRWTMQAFSHHCLVNRPTPSMHYDEVVAVSVHLCELDGHYPILSWHFETEANTHHTDRTPSLPCTLFCLTSTVL